VSIPPSSSPVATLARSLLVTVETVGFATYVHTHAGGQFPGWAPTLALAVVVLAGALLLMTRRVGFTAIAVAVLGLQVLLHESFSALAGTGQMHETGMAMPGMQLGDPVAVSHPPMMLNHLVIGIVTVLLLLCQDRALDVLGGLVRLLVGRAQLVLSTGFTRAARRTSGPRSRLLAAAPRRGPPALVLLTP